MMVIGGFGLWGLFLLLIGVLADVRTGRPVSFDASDLSTAICLAVGAAGLFKDRSHR